MHYLPTDSIILQSLPEGAVVYDTFNHMIADTHDQLASATVRVAITGANDSPISSDDVISMQENDDFIDVTDVVLAHDTDRDIGDVDRLQIVAIDASATRGELLLVDGHLTYRPGPAFDGVRFGEIATDYYRHRHG